MSHTSRGVKTEECLTSLRSMWDLGRDVWDQDTVGEMGLGCKLNSQASETWVTTRHYKLLIPTPATSLEFARECLTSWSWVFQLMTLPVLGEVWTTRELGSVPGRQAQLLISFFLKLNVTPDTKSSKKLRASDKLVSWSFIAESAHLVVFTINNLQIHFSEILDLTF